MQKKLIITIVLLVLVTIVGLLVLLPYRLYTRDVDVAKQHARLVSDELSNMIKLTMLTTKEVLNLNPNLGMGVVIEKINTLYKKFGEDQDFQFRVVRSSLIENQFSAVTGRSADNPQAIKTFETGKPQSHVDGAILTYWSAIKADSQCGHCHKDLNKKKVAPGTTLGVVETVFDLTRQRQRSIRTITEITGFLVAMIVIMAIVAFTVIRKNLIQPIQGLADALTRRAKDPDVVLPRFTTPEMVDLVNAIEERNAENGKS